MKETGSDGVYTRHQPLEHHHGSDGVRQKGVDGGTERKVVGKEETVKFGSWDQFGVSGVSGVSGFVWLVWL